MTGYKKQIGEHKGYALWYENISYNCPALGLWGYSNDLQLKRAVTREITKRAQPITAEELADMFRGKA